MRTAAIVVRDVLGDKLLKSATVFDLPQVQRFVLDPTLKPLHHDVVRPSALPVHADADAQRVQAQRWTPKANQRAGGVLLTFFPAIFVDELNHSFVRGFPLVPVTQVTAFGVVEM